MRRPEPVIRLRFLEVRPAERSPERRGRRHAGRAARVHVVNAVPYEHRVGAVGAEQGECTLHGFRMRLRMGHVVGAHQHLEIVREPGELQAAERALPVLAGHQPELEPGLMQLAQHVADAGIDRHHPVVVGEVEFAIRGHHRLEQVGVVAPVGELDAQRGADAGKPLLIRPRREAMGLQGVVIAVEDQPDRVDQGPVEVEEHRRVACHGGQT